MSNTNALSVIKDAKNRGALVFVGQGIAETVPLYKLEATEIEVKPDNFHSIQGKLVFKKEVCDRIADASGITFTMADSVSERALEEPGLGLPVRTIFVGRAQGKTRLPDGSWRESAPETYAFDYTAKARAEAGTDDLKFKKLAMEYYKAGPMRAATGARLRVIRQLTGMPTAFPPAEIGPGKAFVFSRIIQNTDYILSTPEGRKMAIAMATGAAEMMYGQRLEAEAKQQEPAAESEPPMRNATPAKTESFDDIPFDEDPPAVSPRAAEISASLAEWASGSGAVASLAAGILDSGNVDLKVLEPALEIVKYLGSGGAKGAKECALALEMKPLDPIVLGDLVKKIRKAGAA